MCDRGRQRGDQGPRGLQRRRGQSRQADKEAALMRVLFLQQQPCIRTLKEAAGLRSVLDGLVLGFAYRGQSLDGWYGTGNELFDRWWRLGAHVTADLREVLAEFEPDLVHSH